MTLVGVHHVRVPVPPDGLDRARTFYAHVGFRQVPAPPGRERRGAWMEGPNVLLHLAPEDDFEPHRHAALLAVQVTDAETLRQDLTKRQRKVNDAPALPGGRRFVAYDPSGNRLEFFQRTG